jgi:osmoprotectant transport system permease protein
MTPPRRTIADRTVTASFLRASVLVGASLITLLLASARAAETMVVVGAKKFTENAILAEMMAQVLQTHAGVRVDRRLNLAGTQVCFDALRTGEIDLYAEYTGTGLRNILQDSSPVTTAAAVFARVSTTFRERFELVWLPPFGFNNTYVLIMRPDRASQLGVDSLSDLARVPLRFGLSHEFLQRPDGLPGLRQVYRLNESSTVGMEHDLAYQALAEGSFDVSDGYSTDAKILKYNLATLKDDRGFFPPYEAAPLVRRELLERVPAAAPALALLAGRIDDEKMRRLNHQVEIERYSPARAASEFLASIGLGQPERSSEVRSPSLLGLLWQRRAITFDLTVQHLLLTGIAVVAACLVGIPVGIVASRRPRLAALTVGGASVMQTIPSIALLAFMLPLFGVGARPAIAALFLYGLLPIVRNTVTGLRQIDPQLVEVALGLGMRRLQLLLQLELPLATPVIMAGVRTSTVINIGTATLAAFIGAGGLGDPIVTGLTVTDTNLVLSGALPAALLALIVDALLNRFEIFAAPRGLRVRALEAQ